MIRRAVRRLPNADAGVDIALWEGLAIELRAIIGERGFDSLYARSMHRATAAFPWLAAPPQPDGNAFGLLAACLQAQDAATAEAASAALLNIFIDTLIILIGELLTDSILRKAWGDAVVNQAGQEHRT
jgi:hypothetical protein